MAHTLLYGGLADPTYLIDADGRVGPLAARSHRGLRRQANEDRQAIEGRDAYDEQTLPQVVGSRLSDDTATVVALPEASDDDVAAARSVLEQAGASVADTVEVTTSAGPLG